jgi:hypothetical protein
MLNKKEFYGNEFYAFCCQQYESARVHLKNCGKPKDEYDKYLTQEAKFNSVLYKKMISELEA